MTLDQFTRLRPFVYHLTAADNVQLILGAGCLYSAARVLRVANRTGDVRQVRREKARVQHEGASISLRDQQPLHEKNCALSDLWSFEDLVEHLNDHVYFWPGNESIPISSGLNHFKRYRSENAVVLKVQTTSLLRSNPAAVPLFSRFNSGAPRWSGGKPSPRGPNLFIPVESFNGPAADVVELVFRDEINLPANATILQPAQWRALLAPADQTRAAV